MLVEALGAFEFCCIAQGAMPRPGCFVFDGKRCPALLLGKVAFLPVPAAAPPTAQGATPVTVSGGCFGVAPAPEGAAQGATPVTVSGGCPPPPLSALVPLPTVAPAPEGGRHVPIPPRSDVISWVTFPAVEAPIPTTAVPTCDAVASTFSRNFIARSVVRGAKASSQLFRNNAPSMASISVRTSNVIFRTVGFQGTCIPASNRQRALKSTGMLISL
mmetsp:Transcript_12071/g.34515  ORF Transcript_12071/g.34515 Transcript_12071/m.34515 type:complete len:216 (-) Transcript_12071:1347-1994(-)